MSTTLPGGRSTFNSAGPNIASAPATTAATTDPNATAVANAAAALGTTTTNNAASSVAASASTSAASNPVASTATPSASTTATSGPDIQGINFSQYSAPISNSLNSRGVSLLDIWNYYPEMSGHTLDQIHSYESPFDWSNMWREVPVSAPTSDLLTGATNFQSPYTAPTDSLPSSYSVANVKRAQDQYAQTNAGYGTLTGEPLGMTVGQDTPALKRYQNELQAAYTGNQNLFDQLYNSQSGGH